VPGDLELSDDQLRYVIQVLQNDYQLGERGMSPDLNTETGTDRVHPIIQTDKGIYKAGQKGNTLAK